jgi:hypothetical protein
VLPHRRETVRIEPPESPDPDRGDGADVSPMIGERHFFEEETSA